MRNNLHIKINNDNLAKTSEILRAVAHPLRLKLLRFIDKHNRINVNKIYSKLALEQAVTSQHLRVLRTTDLVNAEREGKYIFYSVNYPKLKGLVENVNNFVNN